MLYEAKQRELKLDKNHREDMENNHGNNRLADIHEFGTLYFYRLFITIDMNETYMNGSNVC